MEGPGREFIEKFRLDELELARTGSWIISLRPGQVTLGSLVLTLNRKCARMSGLQAGEGADLEQAFREVEAILERSFSPDKINYLALMMVDEQVHFHIIPRYRDVRLFDGREFTDRSWPGPPSLVPMDHDEVTLKKIFDFMKSNL